jgi:hypothetical protein
MRGIGLALGAALVCAMPRPSFAQAFDLTANQFQDRYNAQLRKDGGDLIRGMHQARFRYRVQV